MAQASRRLKPALFFRGRPGTFTTEGGRSPLGLLRVTTLPPWLRDCFAVRGKIILPLPDNFGTGLARLVISTGHLHRFPYAPLSAKSRTPRQGPARSRFWWM